MNSEKEKKKFSISNIHLTSTVSMSLVLFLIGLISLLYFTARDMGTQIKENINLSLILDDHITAAQRTRIEEYLNKSGYVKNVTYISKDEALKEHIASMGDDPAKFLGYNPLMASFEIKLQAEFANPDSVTMIEGKLKVFDDINRIAYQKDMVSLVNDNVTRISIVLLGIAIVLLLISIALINNTIRVSIYANRFIINTMKLVGATHWFIRKPYIIRGVINGILASALAMILLLFLNMYISSETGINLMTLNNSIGIKVGLIILLTGIIITALSSYFSVGRYLKMRTDDMYLA